MLYIELFSYLGEEHVRQEIQVLRLWRNVFGLFTLAYLRNWRKAFRPGVVGDEAREVTRASTM